MFRLLIVDDSEAYRQFLKDLSKNFRSPHETYFANDGLDALDFLHCRGPYLDAPRPNLILLDVNMPRMGGLEFVALIKADPELGVIPVIMLSSSDSPSDIREAYLAHANCYVLKPNSLEGADKLIQAIEAFWMDVVILSSCDEEDEPAKASAKSHLTGQ